MNAAAHRRRTVGLGVVAGCRIPDPFSDGTGLQLHNGQKLEKGTRSQGEFLWR